MSPRVSLRQMQVFAAIARSGSTAAAGDGIGLSQSAASAALREIERLLGVALFDRVGRRLVLNTQGHALLPRALALLDAAQALEAGPSHAASDLRALRIGTSTTLGNYVLPALLGPLLPGVGECAGCPRMEIRIDNTDAICACLAAFELDIALIEGPNRNPEIDARPWLRDDMVIVAGTVLAKRICSPGAGSRVTLGTLRQQHWLLRETGSGTRKSQEELLLPRLGSFRGAIEIGSSEAIKRMAAAGMGLACLSRWVVEDLVRTGALRVLATPLGRLSRQSYLAVHRRKTWTPAMERFADAARKVAGLRTARG